jgi:uncharacterized protein (DUF1697 family)
MALIVFLKGVNVGGNRVFRPSLLVRELAHLGAVNVGAAGTFVIRERISQPQLRAELVGKLPFRADLVICRDREVLDLAGVDPYPEDACFTGLRRFVSVLEKRPRTLPGLPLRAARRAQDRFNPGDDEWEINIVRVTGRFVLSFWRRLGGGFLEPNGVVEKKFGVLSTTRTWNTMCAIRDVLNATV